MSHLSDLELRRWKDQGDRADRERVMGHLADCDRCGASYAELLRAGRLEDTRVTDAAGPAEVLDAREFRRAGYDRGRSRPLSVARVAAAAGLAAAVGAAIFLRTPSPAPPSAVRGTELVALSPAGKVGWPVEFRWSSPLAAAAYRVDVLDSEGRRVHSIRTSGETASDPTLRPRLQPGGRYAFVVTALGPDDRELLSSAPRAFVFAPTR